MSDHSAIVTFIENALVQNGLPKILRNLAMIESDFDKNCVSSAQAVGVWQFTPDAAYDYGLALADRSDISKSTYAAIRNLRDLYALYHNWITVIAAYNCGEGNVNKAIRKAGSNKYQLFYTYLPNETINHVYKFMIACVVTNEFNILSTDYRTSFLNIPKNIKPKIATTDSLSSLVSTEINSAFDINIIIKEIKASPDDFYKWNPHLSQDLAANGTASMLLPVDLMPDFLLLKNEILNRSLLHSKTL
ncbi:MAG: lytic transglycosylase domain-containing protein [Chitinophagaceae bacterium]|nr:lytic transglycosylase domain-containing protein [Chitinophagaceae bacterium]